MLSRKWVALTQMIFFFTAITCPLSLFSLGSEWPFAHSHAFTVLTCSSLHLNSSVCGCAPPAFSLCIDISLPFCPPGSECPSLMHFLCCPNLFPSLHSLGSMWPSACLLSFAVLTCLFFCTLQRVSGPPHFFSLSWFFPMHSPVCKCFACSLSFAVLMCPFMPSSL